jgi:glycerol-3-phosphate dehydrogenase
MISIAGGKYTTYRVMARDGIDALAPYMSRSLPESSTHIVPLLGSDPLVNDPPGRLVRRYGSLSHQVLDLIDSDPQLGERVVADSSYLRAEFVYAATHEGALHLDDFLARRTRMSIETIHRGTGAAAEVAGLIGPILGWDQGRQRREVEHYLARVAAERDSQTQPDDRTADAARMGAMDVRTRIAE